MNRGCWQPRLTKQAKPCRRMVPPVGWPAAANYAIRQSFTCASHALRPVPQARDGILGRLAAAGQARIGHEISRGIEVLLVGARDDARRRTVAKELPALLIVLQI